MARTDIARIVARAVLEDIVGDAPADSVPATVDALLSAALDVKRRRRQLVGETIEITFRVEPDPTTPED